jgi:histidinol phosphatase-like PHP family hydrolase
VTGRGRSNNSVIAGLLRDMAAVQPSRQSMWGFKRAASAVFALDNELELIERGDGSLEKIPFVGPKSENIVREVLSTGYSATVEHTVDAVGKRAEIEERRRLRNNFLTRSQVLAALRDDTLEGPSLADYRGDLQMHSTSSDGSQTLSDIVRVARERGYGYCAVTDHSYGLKIARGASMDAFAEQHREMARINRRNRDGFRLLRGVEANIRVDGSVDMEPHELGKFEVVLAAPHSALRLQKDQTDRMIAAVETPGVHILAHPRGRMYGSRPGVNADWSRVCAAAARANVAIEIDGDPARQDLDFEVARLALSEGCLFALDSDAHSPPEFVNSETAIAHARIAGIPRERIINCWRLEELLNWLRTSKV